MNKTGIEYLDYTWNPTHGCSKTSAGCENCWAQRMAGRLAAMKAPGYNPKDPFRVTFHPDRLEEPFQVKRLSRIGVSFMGDLFHPLVAVESVRRIFRTILASYHTFFILTKRPDRMAKVLDMTFETDTFAEDRHIWFGVTAENQEQADRRIPVLLDLPVANRWVSVEPMLGPVDIRPYLPGASRSKKKSSNRYGGARLQWVVCGGESGPGARPMALEWVRSLRGQCRRAGVPFMFKQMLQEGRKVSAPRLDNQACMQLPRGCRGV